MPFFILKMIAMFISYFVFSGEVWASVEVVIFVLPGLTPFWAFNPDGCVLGGLSVVPGKVSELTVDLWIIHLKLVPTTRSALDSSQFAPGPASKI